MTELKKSPITTHVLDLSEGRPAEGIEAVLSFQTTSEKWEVLGKGITNSDGRISNLLPPESVLEPGIYRLVFDTAPYFEKKERQTFYPSVPVIFQLGPSQIQGHYHIPLLLNTYGYSTYRGS